MSRRASESIALTGPTATAQDDKPKSRRSAQSVALTGEGGALLNMPPSAPVPPERQTVADGTESAVDTGYSSFSDFIGDMGSRAKIGVTRGLQAIPQVPVGLWNLAVRAQPSNLVSAVLPDDSSVGKFYRGMHDSMMLDQPEWVREFADTGDRLVGGTQDRMSVTAAAQRDAEEKAQGFVDTAKLYLSNPSMISGAAIEGLAQYGVTAGVPGGVGGQLFAQGAMAGAAADRETQNAIRAMTPERVSQFEDVAKYAELHGMTPEEAVAAIARERGAQAFAGSAVLNAMLPKIIPGATAVERAMARAGGADVLPTQAGRFTNLLVGGVGEAGGEAIAEGGETLQQNVLTDVRDPLTGKQTPFAGVGKASAIGGLTGLAMGSATGATEGKPKAKDKSGAQTDAIETPGAEADIAADAPAPDATAINPPDDLALDPISTADITASASAELTRIEKLGDKASAEEKQVAAILRENMGNARLLARAAGYRLDDTEAKAKAAETAAQAERSAGEAMRVERAKSEVLNVQAAQAGGKAAVAGASPVAPAPAQSAPDLTARFDSVRGKTRPELVAAVMAAATPDARADAAANIAAFDALRAREAAEAQKATPAQPDRQVADTPAVKDSLTVQDAAPESALPSIPEFKGLPESKREIERRAREQVVSDPEAALDAYASVPGTDGGRIINTDEAREIFGDYNSGPDARSANAVAVHEPASWVAKEVYRRRMAKPPQTGEFVAFTGGGTGAGKSTGPRRIPAIAQIMRDASTVFDGNLQTIDGAVEKIDMALNSGREAEIVYTFRDPVQAFTHGALPRAERADYGRTVPIPAHVGTHIGAAKTYLQLLDRYKGDPRVRIRALWNDYDGKTGRVELASREQVESLAALDRDNLASEVRHELERLKGEGRVSARVYSGTIGEDSGVPVRSVRSEPDAGATPEISGRLPRLGKQPSRAEVDGQPVAQRREPEQTASGIPAGLRAEQTDESRRLAKRFNGWLDRLGRGAEQVRFREVAAPSLPDALNRALRAIEQATGTRIVVVRNLTPNVEKFNGLTFRDGTIYVDESSDRPATLVAVHEWVHQLQRDAPELYRRLEQEVRRQGNLPAWAARMRADGNRTDDDSVAEELTADAVADAMTDPDWLRGLAARDVGLFRQVADSILRFLDSMLAKITTRGTNAYLTDVQAFRDVLAGVLEESAESRTREADTESDPAMRRGDFSPDDTRIAFQRRTAAEVRFDALQGRMFTLAKLQAMGFRAGAQGWNYRANDWDDDGVRGKLKQARANLQDKFYALAEAQDDIAAAVGAVVDDAQNAYRLENLAHGRTGDRMEKLEGTILQPLSKIMRDAGLSMDVLEDYLLARHAPERNKRIAAINDDMPDGGSGITTADARAILSGAKPGVYSGKLLDRDTLATLSKAAALVDRMREQTISAMVESGSLSDAQAKALRDAFKYYVPLRGKGETDELGGTDNSRSGGAGRIDYRGPRVRRALGRGEGNLARDIVAEMVGDAQRAIVAAELAKVRGALLRLAMANPNPDAWTVAPVELEYKFSEATGEVYLAPKGQFEMAQDSLLIPLDGVTYRLKIEHPQLREALLNLGTVDTSLFTKTFGIINRWQSATMTRYNPAFVAINLIRDVGFALPTVASQHGAKTALDVMANYGPAMVAVWHDGRDGKPGDASVPDAKKRMIDWAREYAEAGGRTSIMRYDDVETISKKQRRAMQTLSQLWSQGWGGKAAASAEAVRRAVGPLAEVIDAANDSVENAVRLSLYVSLRKQGWSREAAAEASKNVTVNFNRKGKWATHLNAIFLFWNAAVQGSHAVMKALSDKRVVGGLTALGALQGMFAMSMLGMDDDDDGVSLWDSIPAYRKFNAFIVPAPWSDDGYFAVPMPYGFNAFTFLGGRSVQWARDAARDERGAHASFLGDVGGGLIRSFSPVPLDQGPSGLAGNVAGIALGIAANTDDLGRPITQETYGRKVPLSTTGRYTTAEPFKVAATVLNRLGGGSDDEVPVFMPSVTDVSPDMLAHIWREATGGIGGLLSKGAASIEGVAAGRFDSVSETLANAPITSSFGIVASADRAVADRYYRQKENLELIHGRARRAVADALDANGGDQSALARDWPAVRDALGPMAAGLELVRYKRSGTRDDGSRYVAGEIQFTTLAGRRVPKLEAAEGSPMHAYKVAQDAVKERGDAIRDAFASDMPIAERERVMAEHRKARREAQQAMLRAIMQAQRAGK